MPTVHFILNTPVSEDMRAKILSGATDIAGRITGKPLTYLEAILETGSISFAGDLAPAAFAEVYNIGMRVSQHKEFSSELSTLLQNEAGIPPSRFYLNIYSAQGADWGWNGRTFG
mmetsp:Transcript_41545/g.67436  ORF Transcript_41545/g.67436 Transcript_41545/m.67436 type:complete len:115 (+) Transcript_41545:58-402(+)